MTTAALSLAAQSAAMVAVMLVIAAAIITCEFGTRSPRRAMQRARMRLHRPPIAGVNRLGVGRGAP
ncbi:MAG: hypothetical protein ACLP4R_22245 [Solirubrobacteraceae bacterium]